MIARRTLLGKGLAIALALSGCKVGESPSYRYKLTINVETPEGISSAHSVIAVQFFGTMKGFEALGGGSVRARGEAVALDLPNGQTLFVLLRSEFSEDWAAQAHWRRYPKSTDEFETTAQFYEAMIHERSVYPVPREVEGIGREMVDNYPYLVTFKDIADPTSVVRVDPDDLAASFGAGYRLKAITVQVTDEPVTVGIVKKLGWLGKHPEPRLQDIPPGGTTTPTFAQSIEHGDFRRGANQ
jgi:hypothetical protein